MDRWTGVRHGNGACVSFFWTGRRTAWQRRMRLIFSHVAVYVTVVTLFRQSTHNTVLILESHRYSKWIVKRINASRKGFKEGESDKQELEKQPKREKSGSKEGASESAKQELKRESSQAPKKARARATSKSSRNS